MIGPIILIVAMLGAPIDDHGQFVLEGVPAGTWQLRAQTDTGAGALTTTVASNESAIVLIIDILLRL